MGDHQQTIHEFDIRIIYDYFAGSERQGPGSPEETRKALSFINGLTETSKIADIGCGTGGQTMVLAQHTPGEITAVDVWPDFIDRLNRSAASADLQGRVKGIVGDMADLPFEAHSLDLIWSEGAIYNIGFEQGLRAWNTYLKPGGYIAVTENTWFTEERPEEIQHFWEKAYPEIDTIPNKVSQLQRAGYLPVAAYVLPESIWTDYYAWQSRRREAFLTAYPGNSTVAEFVASQRYEAELYDRYKAYYGYVFYIGKKYPEITPYPTDV